MLWKIRTKLGIKPSELDFAAIELANLVKIRGIVTPAEIRAVCDGMTSNQISRVIRKLKRFKIVHQNGMIQYSRKVVGDAEMRENELKSSLTKREYPKITSDLLRLGTRFYEGIVATGFPEVSKYDWLNRLSSEMEGMDYSFFIVPEPTRNLEIYLQQQLKQVEGELYKLTQKNLTDSELEKSKKRIAEKLENIAKGKYILFKIGLYILNKGVTEEKTKLASSKTMSFLRSDGIEGKYATNYQKQIFDSIMPLGTDFLGGRQIIANSTTLSLAFPFRK